jgi:perosamine synthetase
MTSDSNLEKTLLDIISEVIGQGPKSNHEPYSSEGMSRYVNKAIGMGDYAATGNHIFQFEEELTRVTGAKFAVTTNSGTSALHVLLKCAGVVAGDEVLIPAISFVATANAVSYLGATPHFLDVTFPYCTIDFSAAREYLSKIIDFSGRNVINRQTGRPIRAIIGVHVFGHANGLSELKTLAEDFKLHLVEDAAGALGTLYKQTHVGHVGIGGIISFNGNKTVTTGGGGVILTNNEEIATQSRHLSTTAKVSQEFIHDVIGFNYRMPNLNAALGCAQIEELQVLISGQRNLYLEYKSALSGFQGCQILEEPKDCKSNYWQQTLVFDSQCPLDKEMFITLANRLEITLRKIWWPLPGLDPYRNEQSMELVGAWKCHANLINLPSSAMLGFSKRDLG